MYIGPRTRYTIEHPRAWRLGEPRALLGLGDWLAGKLPPRQIRLLTKIVTQAGSFAAVGDSA
ncbi:hypothetical protein PX52LOC_07941 [Limnoglobus roseus]|uniref:Uncharacterized protein n=1 Tax=Limnoglobus roseus TaxID=2598579 RepID=A0A5C1ANK1_9BACT|nr:hypothetical protein PX52LOC_07941 [Limnoglobus roseus]